LANGFIKFRKVIHSLFSETAVFMSGVQLAEAHPEAAISLARTCMKLVIEAMELLRSQEERDEYIEKACNELEIAKDLFASVVLGESSSAISRRFVPEGAEDKRVLILDIAHSHTHRAIDSLKKSKNFELYHELLELLSKARRDSAPTTLYRLAYKMAKP
jgi:hypothetical protein